MPVESAGRPRWVGLEKESTTPREFLGRVRGFAWETRFRCFDSPGGGCAQKPWAEAQGAACPSCGFEGSRLRQLCLEVATLDEDEAECCERYTLNDYEASVWGAFTRHLADAGVDISAEEPERALVGRVFLWKMVDIEAGGFRFRGRRMPFRAPLRKEAPPKGMVKRLMAAATMPAAKGAPPPKEETTEEGKPAVPVQSRWDFSAIDAELAQGISTAVAEKLCRVARIPKREWEAHKASLGPRLVEEDGLLILRLEPRLNARAKLVAQED